MKEKEYLKELIIAMLDQADERKLHLLYVHLKAMLKH